MDYVDPADVPLPAFLDPLLDYLSSALPPPLYSFLLTIFSHSLAMFTALLNLLSVVIRSRPWEWDAQTLIPPLLSVLAAYLALLSLYRTASWMVRTSVWMLKWGTILSVLAAGAGFMLGNQQGGGGDGIGQRIRAGGLIPAISGMLLEFTNGRGNDDDGSSSSRRSRSRTDSQPREARPKSWEAFDRHQEWQYQENPHAEQVNVAEEVQKFVGSVAGIVSSSGWWEIAKGVKDNLGQSQSDKGQAGEGKGSKRKRAGGETKTQDGNLDE